MFTDQVEDPRLGQLTNVKVIPHEHRPWPAPTLFRFRAFSNAADLLMCEDYLYYLDADMLVVGQIGKEIIGDLVATLHPSFYNKKRRKFTYENRPESRAFIGKDEGVHYFMGAFFGGRANVILTVARELADRIDADYEEGIIAIWHDESHWNRYLIDNPPTVELSPSYCYPESWNLPFDKKILALEKDHAALRDTDVSARAPSATATKVVRRLWPLDLRLRR